MDVCDEDLDSPLFDELFFSCEADLVDLEDPELFEVLSDRPTDVEEPVRPYLLLLMLLTLLPLFLLFPVLLLLFMFFLLLLVFPL